MLNFANFLEYYEEHEAEIMYDLERRLSRTTSDMEGVDRNVMRFVSGASAAISLAVLQQYHNWLIQSFSELGQDS